MKVFNLLSYKYTQQIFKHDFFHILNDIHKRKNFEKLYNENI